MVDVSGKKSQYRLARASGRIALQKKTIELIRENSLKKGDVLRVAEIAGVQAAKQTAALIPLAHPLGLSHIEVRARLEKSHVEVTSEVSCVNRTGVEMEALTAVSIALLTVYDMCKAVDKSMKIGEIVLREKIKKDRAQA
jgi:cyclic pyranopterin phosphate synthase